MTTRSDDEPSSTTPEAGDGVTVRQRQRAHEDREYEPVVVKRMDQSVRHPDDVLQNAIREGAEQARRPALSLFLSAVSAGAILSFAAMAVGIVAASEAGSGAGLASRLLVAAVYPLGFVLCLMSGTQLFTEHTALAMYPVLDRRTPARSLLRLWPTILAGNLVGCLVGAGLLAAGDGVIGAAAGYAATATHLIEHSVFDCAMSAVLAGWLMALGGWLILATAADVSQIVVIYATTFLIGLAGLHHSIAGSAEVLAAAMTGAGLSTGDAVVTLVVAVFGNLVGGSLFVGILNYGHIRQTQLGAGEGRDARER
mgnify:CR=1 FL=1